ncbi:MAG: hypothetical protein ACE145_04425 [Terriglobia bacterium]
MATEAEILDESRKVRRLQIVVGLVMNVISQTDLPLEEAQELIANTRRYALQLFPDKELVYDLIYQSRFRRLLSEKYRLV